MIRKILGFALLAVIAMVALQLAFSLVGFVWGLAWFLLKLALIGLVVYWVLKLVSPGTAERVKEMISGRPEPPAGEI